MRDGQALILYTAYENCPIRVVRSCPVLVFSPRVVNPARERLLLAEVVEIFSAQHLAPLSLSTYLETGAILPVENAKPVVLFVSAESVIQRVSVEGRRSSYIRWVFSFLSADWHDTARKSSSAPLICSCHKFTYVSTCY